MQIKATRGFHGQEGSVRKGAVIEVSDSRGEALIQKGLAEVHRPAEKPEPTKTAKPKGRGA